MSRTRKVALVTGGTGGIGRSIVRELARHGYAIAFTYGQNQAVANALCQWLRRLRTPTLAKTCDSSRYEQAQVVVQKVIDRFGHIDTLVNTVGITRDVPLGLMREREWDEVLGVNLKSAYNFSRFCLPHMVRRKRGQIISIASTAGIHGTVGQTNYCASKGGLIAFSRALAREVARFGIRVNVVAPGYIQTSMLNSIPRRRLDEVKEQIPLGRFGRPEEVARLVYFLADDADYMTGQTVVVDGGLLA